MGGNVDKKDIEKEEKHRLISDIIRYTLYVIMLTIALVGLLLRIYWCFIIDIILLIIFHVRLNRDDKLQW